MAGSGRLRSIRMTCRQLLERWRSILASGEPGEMEARVRRFDGAVSLVPRPVQLRCRAIRSDHQRSRVASDAELRQAYRSLEEAQRLSGTGSFLADWWRPSHLVRRTLPPLRVRAREQHLGAKIRAVLHADDLASFDADSLGRPPMGLISIRSSASSRNGGRETPACRRPCPGARRGRPVFIGAIQDVTERSRRGSIAEANATPVDRGQYSRHGRGLCARR